MKGSMGPSRGSAKNRVLTFGSHTADKAGMGSSWNSQGAPGGATRSRERGQALVEFALIAPMFLLIVVGIIQFGIGLNYWLDLNRIANQGARWAVVDHGWENCPSTATTCTSPTLQAYLESEPVSGGLTPTAYVCFPNTSKAVGNPVEVRVSSEYTFLPIMDLGTITLRGKATMRIEQPVTRYTENGSC
jgi:Flp pilus assembly protein TadG